MRDEAIGSTLKYQYLKYKKSLNDNELQYQMKFILT